MGVYEAGKDEPGGSRGIPLHAQYPASPNPQTDRVDITSLHIHHPPAKLQYGSGGNVITNSYRVHGIDIDRRIDATFENSLEARRTVYPREVLNRIKWKEGRGLKDVVVTYLHRGAPGDLSAVRGEEIVELERSFFVTADSKIPYHRIRAIEHRGKLVYRDREPER